MPHRKPLGAFSLLIVLAQLVMAVFAPEIAAHLPNKFDLRHKLEGPSAAGSIPSCSASSTPSRLCPA